MTDFFQNFPLTVAALGLRNANRVNARDAARAAKETADGMALLWRRTAWAWTIVLLGLLWLIVRTGIS